MGMPPLETRAGSPVQAGPWRLDSNAPARGPASSACDSLLVLPGAAATTSAQLVPGTHSLRCFWATTLVALRWPTNPKRGARALGILAWSLDGCGLGALGWLPRGPTNHSPKSEKASKVTTAAEMGFGPGRPWQPEVMGCGRARQYRAEEEGGMDGEEGRGRRGGTEDR